MKKSLLGLALAGVLFLGTNSVFAAPAPHKNHPKNPPRIEQRYQPPRVQHVSVKPPKHVAPPPRQRVVVVKPHKHVAPPPPKRIAYQPQPYYATPVYNQGFALKIGNFFLSI